MYPDTARLDRRERASCFSYVDEWLDRWMERQTEKWMDRKMNSQMNGWTNRGMDGRMYTYAHTNNSHPDNCRDAEQTLGLDKSVTECGINNKKENSTGGEGGEVEGRGNGRGGGGKGLQPCESLRQWK